MVSAYLTLPKRAETEVRSVVQEASDVIEKAKAEILRLRATNRELLGALKGAKRIIERHVNSSVGFDAWKAAKDAIEKAEMP